MTSNSPVKSSSRLYQNTDPDWNLHSQTRTTKCQKRHYSKSTRSHAIAKITARCAQYMSALKIVHKCKISRRLRKNRHITILSLFGGEIIFEVFQPMWSRYLNVTDGQTDGRYTVASPRGKTRQTKNVADIIGIADI